MAYYERERAASLAKDELGRLLYEALHPPWSHMSAEERKPFIRAAERQKAMR